MWPGQKSEGQRDTLVPTTATSRMSLMTVDPGDPPRQGIYAKQQEDRNTPHIPLQVLQGGFHFWGVTGLETQDLTHQLLLAPLVLMAQNKISRAGAIGEWGGNWPCLSLLWFDPQHPLWFPEPARSCS